ncbi:unnamed protein product [Kuraishia capsulata CBS 1993]|uniref:Potassium transport protein n=1 Tax=Kuraishia capsulata CBS 1993 TaxID=1382522 RepID=W6MUA0_9ASCO|nr:uncharacterized protein KUCA_T00001480001 [Kuraishia capsulata CBS 1993]CDK25510.1 unnamed protein product [Kuraishia capsulata CBS 1993]
MVLPGRGRLAPKDTLGFKVRRKLDKVEKAIGPFIIKIIPSFIVAHYVYIMSVCIIGSILIYPQKNLKYIDALFFAVGASTQAGLNTIDCNDLTLFQQLATYLIAMITTPIFIHGSLSFLRLYWFEKYFDDIKVSAKQNYKMRRTATFAAMRSQTMDSQNRRTRSFNMTESGGGGFDIARRNKTYQEALKNNSLSPGIATETSPSSSSTQKSTDLDQPNQDIGMKILAPNHSEVSPTSAESIMESIDSEVVHLTEPSDSEEDVVERIPLDLQSPAPPPPVIRTLPPTESPETDMTSSASITPSVGDAVTSPQISSSEVSLGEMAEHSGAKAIEFASLPQPKRGRIEPRDMYMSIAMMQKNKQISNENAESGPALRISGPAERERHKHKPRHGHHGHHHHHHHGHSLSPHGHSRDVKSPGRHSRSPNRHTHEISEPVETTDHNENHSNDQPSGQDLHEADNEAEISGLRQTPTSIHFAVPDIPRRDGRRDSHLRPLNHEADNELDEVEELESSDEEDPALIARTQSQVVGKSEGRSQLPKRSMTLDNSKGNGLLKSSSFERQMRKRWRKSHPLRKLSRKLTLTRTRSGLGARHPSSDMTTTSDEFDSEDEELALNFTLPPNRSMSTNYLSWNPTLGRNSTFIALTDEQKQELGGVEYCALKLLSKILVVYYIGFHFLAFTLFVPWVCKHHKYVNVLREDGIAPAWWGFYNAASTFNDLGFTLTPDSMVQFAEDTYVLLLSCFFIVVGNTGFPVFLRFVIWVMFKLSPEFSQTKESLGFLLDHPRRCFTLLFPSGPTWWLFFILLLLNALDWILFIILDFHASSLKNLSGGYRVLDGLFQAFSTRTAGFLVVNLSLLHPAIQVSYLVMMYISVLPLAISIRRTNVYEEQSLGVYYDDDSEVDQDMSAKNFISTHLRKQLSFDLWFLFLGLFIICICENGKMSNGDVNFGVFQVMFEITSAYGTVGLSLGYPNTDASFCSQFTVISKLVVIAMMIRGRHRGLPYALDRAIMLPSEKMKHRDDVQAHHAVRRTQSLSRSATGVSGDTVSDVSSTDGRSLAGAFRRVSRVPGGIKRKFNNSVSGVHPASRYYDFPLRTAETQPVTRQFSRSSGSRSDPRRHSANPREEYAGDGASIGRNRSSVSMRSRTSAEPMVSYTSEQFSGVESPSLANRLRSNLVHDFDPKNIVSGGEKILRFGGDAFKRTLSM